ncbi:MAG: Ig-like domain-containing protein [Vicinamibacterales bacterium]
MSTSRSFLSTRLARLIGLAAFMLAAAAPVVSADTLMMPKRDARKGVPVVVWGITTQSSAATCTLDFGDATPVQNCTGADRSYKAYAHTYANQGTFTATLTVGLEVATVNVQVFDAALLPGGATGDNNRSLGINMAIQDGLRYMWYSHANRTTFDTNPQGYWTNAGYGSAETALVVLAFQNHGYKLPNNGSAPTGLYEKYVVRRGLNFVIANLSTLSIGSQGAGDPRVAGLGVAAGDSTALKAPSPEGYASAIAMLPLAGSGALNRVNTEVAGYTNGKTFGEILQRLTNGLSWGQGDSGNGRGSWYYSYNSTVHDGSTVGWDILAYLAAEAGGATVPAFVKTEFQWALNCHLNNDGGWDYGDDCNPNAGSYQTTEKGGIPLQGMAWTGDSIKAPSVVNWINLRWTGGQAWSCAANHGCGYAMFNNFKGLKLQGVTTLSNVNRSTRPWKFLGTTGVEDDWYADYQDYLVYNQSNPTTTTGGNWASMHLISGVQGNFGNSIAELILSPVALVLPDEDKFSTVGLSPATNTALYGGTHTVTAKAESTGGTPVPGATVTFTILTGPNAGQSGTNTTGANGLATFTYTDTGGAGQDKIQATIGTLSSNIVEANWTPITVTATFTAANKVFDGTTAASVTSCTLAGFLAGDDVTCAFTGAVVSFADANVANGIAVSGLGFTLTGTDAGNYNIGPVMATTANITLAPSVTVVTCPASATYTGAPIEACSASVTGVGGLSAALSVSYSDNVNVGTATASASYGGDQNHTGSGDTKTFAITPAPSLTVVTCPASVTYTGAAIEACTASVTGVGGLNDVLSVGYSNNVNVGTATASAAFGGDLNHTASGDTETFEITPAPTVTVVTCPASAVYTGAAIEACTASVTGVGGLSEVLSVSHSDNIIVGTATASASYVGDANHTASSDTETFAITPAPSVTVVTCTASVSYTGAPQTVCSAVVTGPGGLNQAVTPVDYSDNTNVGTAGASASYPGDTNYQPSSDTENFAITPAATITVVSCPVSVTYTGAPQAVCTATVTGPGGLNQAVTPVTHSNHTNVGTAGASANYPGDGNYAPSSDTGSFAITPAALSVTTNDKVRSHTAPNPLLDGTLTGVMPGDGITAFYTTAATNIPGPYLIVAALNDPNGKLGNYSVSITNGTITLTNVAPVAVNDAYTGQWNTTLTIAAPGVKTNDSDGDNDSFTVAMISATSHGTVTPQVDGSFTYLPLGNYYGTDSFTYQLNDGFGGLSNTATVVITISTPCPPKGKKHHHHYTGDGDDHDKGRNGHRKGDGCDHDRDGDHHDNDDNDHDNDDNDHDDDDDVVCAAGTPKTNKDNYSMKQDTTLTLTAKSGVRRNDGKTPTTIELWSNPSHGTVTLAADGSFVYVPAAGFTGTDTFYYVARSTSGIASHTERVTIQVTKKRGNDDDCSNSTHDHDKDKDWSHKGKKYKGSAKNDNDDDDRDRR